MNRRSHSSSPRRYRNTSSSGYRRYSRSRSRSRDRNRDQSHRRKNSRSRSRERNYRNSNNNGDKDLYRDIINSDYHDERDRNYRGGSGYRSRGDDVNCHDDRVSGDNYGRERNRDKNDRDYDRDRADYDYARDRRDYRRSSTNRRYNSTDRDRDTDESDDNTSNNQYYNKYPSNTVIVLGLQSHITEADIMSPLIQMRMSATSIRLIRKRTTGASRGFAFVEFNTVDEAAHWMDLTQGTLHLADTCRATLQYSHSREQFGKAKTQATDWYCGKCGIFNFKRRENCFKCCASREESERGGEGSDEVSNILTKKIMLRNLDVLTNEEGVLTAIQQYAPDLAKKICKVLISRDTLTQTSRGICYLNFDSLVDSMNLHNILSTLEPPLKIDNREVVVSYCIDHENRQIVPKKTVSSICTTQSVTSIIASMTAADIVPSSSSCIGQYTVADVPRLAEYSASLYAKTPPEHAQYLRYYTEYYMSEIKNGSFANLPTDAQMTEANSGAAVALSAIQRKQKKMNSIETTATAAAAAAASAAAAVKAAMAARSIAIPKGNDGKIYPTPDVSTYQYDETSGYYYDPTTGLYYDAHSQYYYNNETGAYLYWEPRQSTYILATPTAAAQNVCKQETAEDTKSTSAINSEDESAKKDKKCINKHDKVKVAKKIVKDMEKWAKQLNQKKDYIAVAPPQPLRTKSDDGGKTLNTISETSGYADVGFSIMEKKNAKLATSASTYTSPVGIGNKILPAYGSDSDDENPSHANKTSATSDGGNNEKDYVDFQKLTCLLCKRAFQSLDILQKHLKMSNLHKQNLAKHNTAKHAKSSETETDSLAAAISYRDRAKERREKYGESDRPPPNPSRERFESEIIKMTSRNSDSTPLPIGSNNVGNRLLQKMGWSEGQGLGRKNQGRTSIIEADTRNSTAGLGNKSGIAPGDDYKTYIKKMMKSRYESV